MYFPTDGEHRRAYMTVLPLANDLGLEVDDHCSRKGTQCVADTIRAYDGPGNILIAWRHKNMGKIQELLGSYDPLEYPDDRYVKFYLLNFRSSQDLRRASEPFASPSAHLFSLLGLETHFRESSFGSLKSSEKTLLKEWMLTFLDLISSGRSLSPTMRSRI